MLFLYVKDTYIFTWLIVSQNTLINFWVKKDNKLIILKNKKIK